VPGQRVRPLVDVNGVNGSERSQRTFRSIAHTLEEVAELRRFRPVPALEVEVPVCALPLVELSAATITLAVGCSFNCLNGTVRNGNLSREQVIFLAVRLLVYALAGPRFLQYYCEVGNSRRCENVRIDERHRNCFLHRTLSHA
jgi:hypothetical protein